MKIINYLIIVLISLFMASCSKITDPVKKVGIGNRILSYQADEKVGSLVIPPDLTQPNTTGIFVENIIIEENIDVVNKSSNIEVVRDKYRRWLKVDMSYDEVWGSSKDFFRSYGFKIEKENKKIGIFETDYLEIETKVPDKSLGMIRAALSKALKTQYGLPIADKYRIRIEATENPNQTEVYLSLSSIGEVVNGALRVWQPRNKDVELETEMLLTLMVYLGSDKDDAIKQIENIQEEESPVYVLEADNKYATLVFPYSKKKTWNLLGWSLDELNIDIEDRDPIEGSYYIKSSANKGFFSNLLSSAALVSTYKLTLKDKGLNQTEINFIDLNEEYDQKTISYSFEFFNDIASKFQ